MAATALLHRAPRALVAGLILTMVAVALALLGPGQTFTASGQVPAAPTCPAGTAFNAGTGQCETPTTATPCPAGTTLVGATCTVTLTCPAIDTVNRQVIGDPTGGTTASCAYPGASAATLTCPAGTTITSFVPGSIGANTAGSITCTGAPGITCPAGFTQSGSVCVVPPTLSCPTGFSLSGSTCVLVRGTAGDVDASGGDAGSVRGGDGGRGGSGTLPICNQNTNDSGWEELVQVVDEEGYVIDEYIEFHEAEPSLECEAGARGGDGGDAGIAEAGDGGIAFSVG